AQARQPSQRSFRSRRDIELGFVTAGDVALAQPAMFVGSPLIEIGTRVARNAIIAKLAAQSEKIILKMTCQVRFQHLPDIRRQEHAVEKARDQRGEVRTKKPPSGMNGAKSFKRLKVHGTACQMGVRN